MNSLVPYSIVTGTIGTLVSLYILDLGGSVVLVGLAAALSSAVAIPSAILWGSVSDRLKRRRPIIVGSFGAMAFLVLLFVLARNPYEVILLYVAYGVLNAAPSTPINLLIMETQPKGKWSSSYARYSWLTALGQTLGLLTSSVWTGFLPLKFLVVLLSSAALVATFVALRLISEPPFLLEGTALLKHSMTTLQRIVREPIHLLRSTVPRYPRNILKILRSDFTGDLRVLYASILVFYIATGLNSAGFVPLLRYKGVSDSLIFAGSTVNIAVQVYFFRYFGSRLQRKSFVRDSVASLILRGCAFGMIGVVAYFLSGMPFYLLAVLFFSIASGVCAAVYYTTSTTMIFDTVGSDSQGYSLGICTTFTGLSTTVGALASGYISFYLSYYVTFLVMGAGFGLCAWITWRLRST